MRLFISAGEASGDTYAAELIRELELSFLGGSDEDPFRDRLAKDLGLNYTPRDADKITSLSLSESLKLVEIHMRLMEDFQVEPQERKKLKISTFGEFYRYVAEHERRELLPETGYRFSNINIEGIFGVKTRAAGAKCISPTDHWGAIGIVQSLKLVPKILAGYYRAKRSLNSGSPGVFLPIDFGYANVRLAKHAKKRGWKVIYFIPPGSWRRDKQGADLPNICDAIITPFAWSAEILKDMGANVHWFGHPLKQLMGKPLAEMENRKGIAVLPGSRKAEVLMNLPQIASALRDKEIRTTFVVAPNLSLESMSKVWKELCPGREDLFVQSASHEVLSRSMAAIVCSGTATLEAALCLCPHVVIYRLTKMTEWEARLLRFKPKFISQPNILLDREVVTELIQYDATGEKIWNELQPLLENSQQREKQLDAFRELSDSLGNSDALTRSAELIKDALLQSVRNG